MDKESKKIIQSLKTSMYIVVGANIVAASLFFIAFVLTNNFWFLVAVILVALASVGFVIFGMKMKGKYDRILNKASSIEQRKS